MSKLYLFIIDFLCLKLYNEAIFILFMKFTQKYFVLIIVSSLAIGLVWHAPGLFFKQHLIAILAVMMTLSCLKIDLRKLKEVKNDWWRYGLIMGVLFIIPTILVYPFRLFISQELFIGLLLCIAVPCAVSVVFFSDFLHGDPPKALVSTTIAHVLSPFVTPFIVWIFIHKEIGIDVSQMAWFITKLIIIPLIIAQVIRLSDFVHDKLSVLANNINTYLLFALLWGMTSPVADLFLNNLKSVGIVACIIALLVSIPLVLVIFFGRNKQEGITWAIVSTYRNLGLSSAIAFTMFGPLTAVVPVVYTFVGNLVIAGLQRWSVKKLKY